MKVKVVSPDDVPHRFAKIFRDIMGRLARVVCHDGNDTLEFIAFCDRTIYDDVGDFRE